MRTPGRDSLMGACLGLLAIIAPASAQEDVSKYPSRAIHIIVGFAAGGGNDIIARVFGQKLAESLGQPVIVENKPGGGAIVATEYVAKSAPDGYTLLMSASGISINPDKMNYASSSASFQLVTELFKQKTGAPMQVIPYKSANESVLAVISGQVTMTIADTGSVYSQIKSGTVRALVVAAPRRLDDLPDVPTMKEAGADVDAILWSGIFVPKATPPEIVRKLEAEFTKIAKEPDVIARLKPL